jgi:hypothetical protein
LYREIGGILGDRKSPAMQLLFESAVLVYTTSKRAGKLAVSTNQEKKKHHPRVLCATDPCLECIPREFLRNVLEHGDKPRNLSIAGFLLKQTF